MPLSRREQKERQQDPRHHHVETKDRSHSSKNQVSLSNQAQLHLIKGRLPGAAGPPLCGEMQRPALNPTVAVPLCAPNFSSSHSPRKQKCLRNHVKCLADALPLPGGDFDSCGALHVGFCPWFLYVIKISYVGNYVFVRSICTLICRLYFTSCVRC